jgi:hypothetical protein
MTNVNETKTAPYFDNPFENFWYDQQLTGYITQFMAVFSGMYVRIGKNDFNSQTDFIEVPITYGGVDRVVSSIIAQNTQNLPLRLPMFSAKLVDMDPAPERFKGVGTVERKSYLPRGQALPDGVQVMHRKTPVPYKLAFELNIFTSNDLQKFQILEQILPLFDPSIQIQTSDDPFDGGKITVLTLETIGFEENYPAGAERKINTTSMVFSTYGWLSVPVNFKDDFIKSVHLRLSTLNQRQDIMDAIAGQDTTPIDITASVVLGETVNADVLGIPPI